MILNLYQKIKIVQYTLLKQLKRMKYRRFLPVYILTIQDYLHNRKGKAAALL